jgi:RNA polymerase subunit RPABC4/transcription elongation factor Spt4
MLMLASYSFVDCCSYGRVITITDKRGVRRNMKKCKSCQTEISDKAKKCPNCRADQRNWFSRHKILTGILIIILIAAIASAAGGGSKKDGGNNSSGGSAGNNQAKTYRFNERADKQAKDVEIVPGESATIDGRKLTVTSVERKASLGQYSQAPAGKVYVVANVTLENTSDKVKTYNIFDFRIQTAGGQVLDIYIGGENNLSSGDLVVGGKATGNVVFEVPVETASQYIIFKPNAAMSDRAIIEVKQ